MSSNQKARYTYYTKDKDRVIIVRAHTNEFFYSSSYKAQIKVKGYCKTLL